MPEPPEQKPVTDRSIIELLRRAGSCTISDFVEFAGVTATAIRQRLNRLMDEGLVIRRSEPAGRGRPTHRYSLSPAGMRCGGDNYEDLAWVLWSELRAVEDPDVRHGLLKRIMGRLAELYREQVEGQSIDQRMASLVGLMQQRDVPFEVQAPTNANQLPVLKALACPYPDLAEQDRAICSLEKMLISEVLGESMRLSSCRLDGASGCTFELSSAAPSTI